MQQITWNFLRFLWNNDCLITCLHVCVPDSFFPFCLHRVTPQKFLPNIFRNTDVETLGQFHYSNRLIKRTTRVSLLEICFAVYSCNVTMRRNCSGTTRKKDWINQKSARDNKYTNDWAYLAKVKVEGHKKQTGHKHSNSNEVRAKTPFDTVKLFFFCFD